MKFGTQVIHAGIKPDPATGAIMTPIYQTSTYVQSAPGQHHGYEYSRTQNPTRDALQQNLAALEQAQHGLCFASGMAATDAVIKLLKPGDEVLVSNDLYGGTYRIFTKIYQDFGIRFKFIDMTEAPLVAEHFTQNTKLVWVETPSNPMMNIIDIKALGSLCKDFGAWLCVDNTFATPCLQNPLTLGATIVVHSATKYLSGHSDVVLGSVMLREDALHERLAFIQNSSGAVPGPMDCFLALRGIKTLQVRMERHCQNAQKIAHFLKEHPKVQQVFWPGFTTHKNHAIAKEQMRGFGGMVSFVLKKDDVETATQVMRQLQWFALAESLGGVESLCGHPASMTHAAIPKEERLAVGLKDSLIRLSVGIEDAEDLIADITQALDAI